MAQTSPGTGTSVRLDVPAALIASIAAVVVDELERRGGQLAGPSSPYLTVDEAATYLRAAPQRVYDLVSAKTLTPARDGRRLLFRRDELDTYLAGGAS